jgi:hypothetical protein
MKRGLIGIIIALASFSGFDALAQAAIEDPGLFRKGEVIVELKPGASIGDVNARNRTATIRRIYGTNLYRLRIPAGKKEKKWLRRLSLDPDVLSASLNRLVASPISAFARSRMSFPEGYALPGRTSSDFLSQSGLFELLNLEAALLRSRGRGVIVAVVDTGIDRSHPLIGSNLWADSRDIDGNGIDDDNDGLVDDSHGWDFVDNDNDPSEVSDDPQTTVAGHGTFIAGLIKLLAPDCTILPIRAFGPDGTGDVFTVSEAIKYAADHGARVINLSFGTDEESPILQEAIKYALERGVVLAAAVGNNNSEDKIFPASSNGVMGVAAIDLAGHKAPFSNFGSAVSVAAPGVSLISSYPGGEYATWSGTSFAAPFSAAEAALVLAVAPSGTDPKRLIETTAVSIDELNPEFAGKLGKGRINPLGALRLITTPGPMSPPSNLHAEVALLPTSIEAAASGRAEITIQDNKQEFQVLASGLIARATYSLVVDGLQIKSGLTASAFGGLKIEFSTEPDSSSFALPPELNPVSNIKHVELRNAEGRVVLRGDFAAAGGTNPTGQLTEKEIFLAPTGILPQAEGRARIQIEPQRQELRVIAEELEPSASYQIVVDGRNLGTASSNAGFFRAEFTSDGSSGRLLPAELLPATNIRRVQVLNLAGQVVLQGDFQGSQDVGGGRIYLQFEGIIERLPSQGLIGNWTVSGRTVQVNNSTKIDQEKGLAVIGATVEVKGYSSADVVEAAEVEVKSSPAATDVDKEIRLAPTPAAGPEAEGRARVKASGGREQLEIEAKGLTPSARYMILVDGFNLGSFSADSSGRLRQAWSSAPEPEKLLLPDQLRPVANIRRIEIANSSNAVVLSGSF